MFQSTIWFSVSLGVDIKHSLLLFRGILNLRSEFTSLQVVKAFVKHAGK